MICPEPDRLAALPQLDGDERAAIIDHAANCPSCHAIMAELLPANPAMAATVNEDPAAVPPESAAPLAQIDRYQIVRKIGAGAMGVVYAANDPELARPVAVKVLRAGGSPDRMRREAQALAKLAHENVVAVYDVGEHQGSMFVTMALVAGDNLRSWLARPQTTDAILDAIVQAGRGVEAAHAAGIVHRDLKPDNIFVADSGGVLVGDFGLARSGNDALEKTDPGSPSNELTATGALLGTPAYMSPELLAGEASPASDQFALCVTAWEALYGERPFAASTIGELAIAVRRGVPRTPVRPKVPARVRAALRRGLAADPSDRFPSVTALLAELAPRRRRWPYLAAALALVAIGIVFVATRGDASLDAELARCESLAGPRVTLPEALQPAVASALTNTVDRYLASWVVTARAACLADVRHERVAVESAAIQHCLDRRASTLEDILETPKEPDVLDLIEHLEPPETCRDAVPSSDAPALTALQRDLDRESIKARAERIVDIDPLVTRAEALGNAGVRAEAQFVLGLMRLARGEDAEPALVSATQHADVARDDRLRTRATAMRAATAARAGRTADALTQRDLARSGAVRSADPVAVELVERATLAIAHAANDLAGEIRALRVIEAALLARFGEESIRVAAIQFDIGAKLQAAKDPGGDAMVERALAKLERLSPKRRVMTIGAEEIAPARRLEVDAQLVAFARRARSPNLPDSLGGFAADCFLVSDYECAFTMASEAADLVPAGQVRDEFLDDASAYGLEAALHAQDKERRWKRLDQVLALIDRMSPAMRDRDAAQSTRGRALLALGRTSEAVGPLSIAVDAAERAEPRKPFRIMVRSFALAQALWLSGGTRERTRARMLVEQANAAVEGARAMFEADREMYGGARSRLESEVAALAAWRRTHP